MGDNDAPLLLDVSRLVWRRWSGTRATGIDRICLAWLEHYGPRSQAVIVHRRGQAILPFGTSQALFRLLTRPDRKRADTTTFRASLAALAIRRSGHLRDALDGRGRIWLNAGHTGLDSPRVARWARQRHLRLVPLVHDLIPITHPQYCRPGEDERHRQRMRTALELAVGIVTNSDDTRAVLGAFAQAEGRALPRSVVAWPGTPFLPHVVPYEPAEPVFVVLGTIEGRKNHVLLLSIWRRLIEGSHGQPVPKLVLVGRRGWQADAVFAQLDSGDFGDRVSEVGPLDDDQLAQLLASARALLFPSLAEGFGIPLVEALAAGVPVIASDLSVFREIGQGVPEVLPASDPDPWQKAILDYAKPDSLRRAEQLQRMAAFTPYAWHNHFQELDDFLSKLE